MAVEKKGTLTQVDLRTEKAIVRRQKATKPSNMKKEQETAANIDQMTVAEMMAAIKVKVLTEHANQKVFIWYFFFF